jgi:hypothetical protein
MGSLFYIYYIPIYIAHKCQITVCTDTTQFLAVCKVDEVLQATLAHTAIFHPIVLLGFINFFFILYC